MITFERVTVTVDTGDGPRVIVPELTLELTEAKIALIGANGSGKSTMARLINGLVLPSSGSVTVTTGVSMGEAMAQASRASTAGARLDTKRNGRQVRGVVGFVFTDPQSGLVMPTTNEDLQLSLKRSIKDKTERAAKAADVLASYGLAGQAGQSVHTLSGGQAQLLAVASALATDPQVLVADEPTTLLDLKNTRLITDLLLALPQQVVIATHDLELAAGCDRVICMQDGRVLADGDPAEVIARYRESI